MPYCRSLKGLEKDFRTRLESALGDLGDRVVYADTTRGLDVEMAKFVCGKLPYEYVVQFFEAAGLGNPGPEAQVSQQTTLKSGHLRGRAVNVVWDDPSETEDLLEAVTSRLVGSDLEAYREPFGARVSVHIEATR